MADRPCRQTVRLDIPEVTRLLKEVNFPNTQRLSTATNILINVTRRLSYREREYQTAFVDIGRRQFSMWRVNSLNARLGILCYAEWHSKDMSLYPTPYNLLYTLVRTPYTLR